MQPEWNVAVGSSKVMPAVFRGVGITQRLKHQIPLGLVFRSANGQTVRLGRYFGAKPVILSLVYFNCPMLCPLEERGLLQALKLLKFTAGKQFNVVTVSFDPHDTPQIAAEKKALYVRLYGRPAAAQGWHFLTGDEASIAALTRAVGFHYRYIAQTHQFAHAVAIVVLTPTGKLAQYFYGIKYPAGNLRLALVQASHEKIGSPVDEIILYCYRYSVSTGKYDVVISHVLILGGGFTLLLLGGLLLVLMRGGRRHGAAEQARLAGVATDDLAVEAQKRSS
ncbi:MAG: SCO family protein [Terriglobia bacterium]